MIISTVLQRAIVQGIPLLYGSTGEIITEKSGNLNLGIPASCMSAVYAELSEHSSMNSQYPPQNPSMHFLQLQFLFFRL